MEKMSLRDYLLLNQASMSLADLGFALEMEVKASSYNDTSTIVHLNAKGEVIKVGTRNTAKAPVKPQKKREYPTQDAPKEPIKQE